MYGTLNTTAANQSGLKLCGTFDPPQRASRPAAKVNAQEAEVDAADREVLVNLAPYLTPPPALAHRIGPETLSGSTDAIMANLTAVLDGMQEQLDTLHEDVHSLKFHPDPEFGGSGGPSRPAA
jgi:hypothetical protein